MNKRQTKPGPAIKTILAVALSVALNGLIGGCRPADDTAAADAVELVPVLPGGDLADRVVVPELEPGEVISVSGRLADTGALTVLTDYHWDASGITRTVYYLLERQPDLDGLVVELEGAVVNKTGVFGYGVELYGGELRLPEVPELPRPGTDPALAERLAELDLDALSKHPRHNGGYRPSLDALAALGWEVVDLVGPEGAEGYLLRSVPLSLPPFADPQIHRWLQGYALVDESGRVQTLWVGVRGSFAE